MATVPCSWSSPTPAASQHQGQQCAAIQEPRNKTNFFFQVICVSKLVNFSLWWNYWRGHGCDPAQSIDSEGCSGTVAAFEAPEQNHGVPKPWSGEKLGTLSPFQRQLYNILPQAWYTSHTCHQCVLPAEGKHVRQMGRSSTERGSVTRLSIYSY